VRNYFVFGRLIFVRDNLGLELSISNNDCAPLSFEKNLELCFAKFHPNVSTAEATRVLKLGEPQYNDVRLHEAIDWIRSHPSKFVTLSTQRFFAFWMPSDVANPLHDLVNPGQRKMRGTIYLLTLLSVLGLAILYSQNRNGFVLCALWLGLYPPVYYFIQYIDRYRYPIMWVTFLLGAFPLKIAFTRTLNSWKSRV
jgi:hypothetical protein